ncbi:hypothetical protein JW935_05895 [candidate division KSB1 bacterium]|nr:hypothetical protein [candidate division KSB1 bacterium]
MKKIIILFLINGSLFAETVFQGVVLNASRDSVGVENIPVHLQVFLKGALTPSELNEVKSGTDGFYRFTVEPQDSANYIASVDFDGVRYYSRMVSGYNLLFSEQHKIVVYDSSHNAAGVTTTMHHVFIEHSGRGALFRETRIMNNPGSFAVTGAVKMPGGREATFRFSLPAGAQEFTPLSEMFGNDLVGENGFVYDLGIALPGHRHIVYSWAHNWRKDRMRIVFNIDYPTRNLNFFISDPRMIIFSDDLQDYGDFVIRGSQFRRYGAEELKAGQKIEFRLKNAGSPQDSPAVTILAAFVLLSAGLIVYVTREKNGRKNKKNDPH